MGWPRALVWLTPCPQGAAVIVPQSGGAAPPDPPTRVPELIEMRSASRQTGPGIRVPRSRKSSREGPADPADDHRPGRRRHRDEWCTGPRIHVSRWDGRAERGTRVTEEPRPLWTPRPPPGLGLGRRRPERVRARPGRAARCGLPHPLGLLEVDDLQPDGRQQVAAAVAQGLLGSDGAYS